MISVMTFLSNADFLVSVAEPTRLRILNCVATAPLFVTDLVAILGLPQPTVSRHLKVLRDLDVVKDLPIPPFVLYQLDVMPGARARLIRSVLDAVRSDPAGKAERAAALARSRSRVELRTAGAEAHAG
jgi:ArsR family transcriptional regulator